MTGGGWNITEAFSHNLVPPGFVVTGATWEIRSGTTLAHRGGTLVASGTTAAPIVTVLIDDLGFSELEIKVTGLNVFLPVLPAGQFYWLNVTPINDLTSRSFISETLGANCVGTPCGNDGNTFWNSNYFNIKYRLTAFQYPGRDPHDDYSMGVNGTVAGAPTPTPTPTPTPSPPGALWYNGDFDGINGLPNERDTSLGSGQFASVYDNFNVTGGGWNVTAVFSDNLADYRDVIGATWEIRTGTTVVTRRHLGRQRHDSSADSYFYRSVRFSLHLQFQVKVTGLNVFLPILPAGQFYWLNVTPIGDLTGRSFDSTTSGANCVGTPCGNDQNAFFNSNFFGVTFGSTADQGQPYDFSMGVNGTVVGALTPTPTPTPNTFTFSSGRTLV